MLAVAILAIPEAAWAASKDAKERAARTACLAGDYAKGVALLADLYVSTLDAVHIYNQGRCFEQNGMYEEAIIRFREFQRKRVDGGHAPHPKAEEHIADCQKWLDKKKPSTPTSSAPSSRPALEAAPSATARVSEAPVTPPAVPSTPAPLPSAPAQASAPVATDAVAPPPSSPGRGLRIAGIVSGVTGLAVIGAGVGFALKTQSISSDESKNGPTKAQEDERKAYETLGWVCYGVGAAALATGVVLYIVGWPTDESQRVSLLPSVSPTGGSLLLAGRF